MYDVYENIFIIIYIIFNSYVMSGELEELFDFYILGSVGMINRLSLFTESKKKYMFCFIDRFALKFCKQ